MIPYFRNGAIERIRIRRPAEHLRDQHDPRYYIVPGSSAAAWLIGKNRRAYIIVETELDGLLIDQQAAAHVGVVALDSSTNMPDEHCHRHLHKSLVILNALDFDKAGAKAWSKWPEAYPQSERWPVPQGKDPGEAFQQGVDITKWILAGLPPAWHVGPSRFIGMAAKGVAVQSEPEVPPEPPVDPQAPGTPDQPPKSQSVNELADLLKRCPVTIISTENRTAMNYPRTWANEPLSRRISQLIYFDQACKRHIENNLAQFIDGENFFTDQ